MRELIRSKRELIARILSRVWVITIVAVVSMVSAQGLKIDAPYLVGFHPLDDEPNERSMLKSQHPVLMNLKSKIFIDTASINFEKRQITFRRTDPLGYTIWEYHYPELSDYLSERKSFAVARDWKKSRSNALGAADAKSKKDLAKLQWELPVQYPSWAQRILGNDPPKLVIDGSLKLTIGFNWGGNKRTESSTEETHNDFILDEDYQFSITGTVGRLINVNIKTSKDNSFEFSDNLQNFKIEYKESTPGELEDEIIQEVVAGYTSFDMPGQSLAGIVEAKKGLFGIKLKTKFGPLMLTSIAATEQAESNSKTFSSSSGSGSSSAGTIADYIENKFYYLDTTYRTAYIHRYGTNGSRSASTAPAVDSLEVWVKADKISTSLHSNYVKRNVYLTNNDTTQLSNDSLKKTQGYDFLLLKRDVHYILDGDDGYIRFVDTFTIQNTDQIAIYLRSENNTIKKGQYRIDGTDTIRVLWTLKPSDIIDKPSDDPARYYLMWRNVYKMQASSDLSNLKLSILKKDLDDESTSDKNGSVYYSKILGIADDNGKPLVEYSNIFYGAEGFFIFPPWDTTQNADLPFMNPALGEDVDTVIYKVSERTRSTSYESVFSIQGSGASKQTTFTIDYGIIEGTDKVWADGVELERDKDYVVNYDMGTLELVSMKAKAASSIKADYQTQSVFVPDKKVFLGANGQVQLPFLSDKSYVGGTILYQDVKVSEDIPTLGQEPYSKVLFDVNSVIDLEPEWMTKLVNKIPFIETSAASQLKLDVEVAHSKMNPNPDGKAYVDDFEDSKASDNIGSTGTEWHQASPSDSILMDFHEKPPAWDFYWFTPGEWDDVNRIKKTNLYVFDEDATASAMDGYVSMVRFHCTPAPASALLSDRYENAWAGVMTPIPSSFADKSKMKYIDFYIKDESIGTKGKLIIQLGQMREDLSINGGLPNGNADKEDTTNTRTGETATDALDRGLDTLTDKNEFFIVPDSADGWDTLWYGNSLLGRFVNDPSKDNALDYINESTKGNYRSKCKTENSTYFESEDINNNATVETAIKENYFQYVIDLNDTNMVYYDKTAKIQKGNGWRKVHLPLKSDLPEYAAFQSQSGSPKWTLVNTVRMIWTGFDKKYLTSEHKMYIAEMGFVGNQWQSKVDSTGAQIEALAISNKEDTSYIPPMTLDVDQSTNETVREQSLKLKFSGLQRGKEVLVTKNTSYQDLNFTAYQYLNLLVYGKRNEGMLAGSPLYDGDIKFVFRFGTDSSTYYEYRSEIIDGWNKDSGKICIDLKKLAKLKDAYMIHHPDTVIDTTGTLSVKAPTGRQPNLANIKWMALGVVRDSTASSSYDSGEIWVDEMVLSGIDEISGWAARGSIQTKWADLFNLKTDMEYTNGNYRQLQDIDKTLNNSTMTANVDASLALDKFLPQKLGVNLPVGVVVSGAVDRPQLKSNDVSLSEDGSADNLSDMTGDVLKMMLGESNKTYEKESELYATQTGNRKIYTSYNKTSPSENWISNFTADRISTNFTYANKMTDKYDGTNPTGDTVYVATTGTDSYSGALKYDLSPKDPPKWTKFKPIKKDSSSKWLPEQLRDYEFSLLPSTFNFTLFDGSYLKSYGEDNEEHSSYSTKTFDVKHSFQMDYTPISPLLKLGYSLSIDRDLDTVAGLGTSEMFQRIFDPNEDDIWRSMSILYGERTRTQRGSLVLDPQFFGWLTNTVDYSSGYTGSLAKIQGDTVDYYNSSIDIAFNFTSRIDFIDLISKITSKSAKTKKDSVMISFENGFKKVGFRSIGFTYSANTKMLNYYLSPSLLKENDFSYFDYLTYQLGAKGRSLGDVISGDMDDYKFGGMRSRSGTVDDNDSRNVKRSYKFTSGLDLTVPFEISFNPISFGWSTEYTITPPDLQKLDTTLVMPELSVNARTPVLMKISVVSDLFRSLNLSSNFSYRKTTNRLNADRDTTNRFDLTPLISASGTIKKWPISVNYSHKFTKEIKRLALTGDTTTTHGNELTLSYEIEKSNKLNEIKILYWTIPIKGKTTVGMTASHENSVVKARDKDKTENLVLSINPYLTYIFTNHVTGTLRYKGTQNKEKIKDEDTDIDKSSELALEIDIRFR